ncbi:MAG: fatty acid desaturase [Myxococcota bacterium]|jgi:fatty acid desaturase
MASSKLWRRHVGHLAWPTLLLAGAVILGEVALWAAVLGGEVSLPIGGLLATLLAYVAFTPLHDASHGAIGGSAGRAWVDTATGHIMGLPLLAPFPILRSIHLRHHGATNDPDRDPDYWVHGSGALSTAARCATIAGHYYVVFFSELRRPGSAMRRQMKSALLGLSVQILGIAGLSSLGLGAEALALWVVPAVLASGLLAFLFDWVPHHHTARGRHVDTRLLLVPGLSLPMLFQNYHLIHHLYPRVPFYRYATLYRELVVREPEEVRKMRIYRWAGWA